MIIRYICQSGHYGKKRVEQVEFDMRDSSEVAIPRVGEWIEPFLGWASFLVVSVTHRLRAFEIVVEVTPDYSGEIAEHLRSLEDRRKKQ